MVLGVDLEVGTPSVEAATSCRIRRVTRQGAQKAEENCSSVARSPSWVSHSVPASTETGSSAGALAAACAGPSRPCTGCVPRNRPSVAAR